MATSRTSRPLNVTFDESGLDIIESHHSDDFRMDATAHPFWKALLVIAGSGRLLAGREGWPLAKSSLILVPPQIPHRISDDPAAPLSIYVLCVKAVAPFDNLRGLETGRPAQVRDREIISLAGSVMRRLFIEKTRSLPGRRLITSGLAAMLLGRIVRNIGMGISTSGTQTGARTNVERYAQGLATALGEPDTLDSVARRLGLSRRRFTQLFREITGQAWLKHIRGLRIEHAKHLLRDTDRSVAAVAFECGFEDLSNFYRAFKTATREPPRAWREHSRIRSMGGKAEGHRERPITLTGALKQAEHRP
jgi:AraC family L-rhamnose operon regulatory protein RhaS